jgi:hypothetical protein
VLRPYPELITATAHQTDILKSQRPSTFTTKSHYREHFSPRFFFLVPASAYEPRDHYCKCLQGEHAAEVADKLPARKIRPPNIMHVLDEDTVSIAGIAVDGGVERHENILCRNSEKSVLQ